MTATARKALERIRAIRLDRGIDWEQTTSFIQDGYRMVATKRALAKLGQPGSAR